VRQPAGFIAAGVPVFEIRKYGGMTNMLVSNPAFGRALAETLLDKSIALLRGHGNVVVGPNVQTAVYRAIYTEINARLHLQAISLGGPITCLDKEEGQKIDSLNTTSKNAVGAVARSWELWKRQLE
jgi:HCOMODA/2-hydroxy-3-carboxy-muconic semialdehyde decarboxylase